MTLEKLFDYYRVDGYFMDAVDALRETFHVYDEDEGVIVEENVLDSFEWRSGVSKVCILFSEFVLKTGISGYCIDYDWEKDEWLDQYQYTEWDTNYADLEYQVYQQACAERVDKFFAAMLRVDEGIYMQEHCDATLEDLYEEEKEFEIPEGIIVPEYKSHEEIEKQAEKDGLENLLCHMRTDSYAFARANFSTEDLLALQAFVKKYDINDIHNGNIGICGNTIKIFDYSGYCSTTSEQITKFSK